MKMYKCPYCMHPFHRADAPIKQVRNFTQYLCPNVRTNEDDENECGKELPLDFFNAESLIISLAGGTDVGKTCYAMALLHQLLTNRKLWAMGISGDLVGEPHAVKRFYEIYKRIGLGESIQFMTSKLKEESLIVRIIIQQETRIKHIYLSLFDNKGELVNDPQKIIQYIPNIYQSDGLLYLFEPKQFAHLWDVLEDEYISYGVMTDYYQILYNIVRMIIQRADITTPQNIVEISRPPKKIPIGLVMSKIDIVKKLISIKVPNDNKDLLIYYSGHRFDNGIIDDISNEVERLIGDINGGDPRLSRIVNHKRINHKYFGVKSVVVDEESNTPVSLDSNGVLLPLIWLLKEFKILK